MCLLLIVLVTIIIVRLKSKANNSKRTSRQPSGNDKQVIVHQRSNGQVASSVLETDTDPDLIQVKYGRNYMLVLIKIYLYFRLNTENLP